MRNIIKVLRLIKKQAASFRIPSVTEVAFKKNPYRILVSCILSLRTKDKTTIEASERLFEAADSPQKMMQLSAPRIRKLIYPVGFYRNKARVILELSRRLVKERFGKVPDTLDELLEYKGVGRKTANLVLGLGFGIPSICVDTHVHRISNRLGWVHAKNPSQTEDALKKIVPRKHWIELNTLFVAFGQNVCVPISPFCSRCYVYACCKRRNVTSSR